METMALQMVRDRLKGIQSKLDFEDWGDYPQFATKKGLGRTALLACVLGLLWGIHFVLWIQVTLDLARVIPFYIGKFIGFDRMILLWQWCSYIMALCTFHLLEFFATALCNPSQATADSFVVNHSTSYTAAALTSWTEFVLRFFFFPTLHSTFISVLGFFLVILSQAIRTLAMVTAGESFNHLIQTSKKDNHVLITHGIYSIFRHPSYVGFYYWSVGTQLLLGNPLHALMFAVVSWTFFKRRIEFEEHSLCIFFPDEYPAYMARTWMGIPFLRSRQQTSEGVKQD